MHINDIPNIPLSCTDFPDISQLSTLLSYLYDSYYYKDQNVLCLHTYFLWLLSWLTLKQPSIMFITWVAASLLNAFAVTAGNFMFVLCFLSNHKNMSRSQCNPKNIFCMKKVRLFLEHLSIIVVVVVIIMTVKLIFSQTH